MRALRRFVALSFLALGLALAPSGAQADSNPAQPALAALSHAQFDGTFRYAGDAREDGLRRAAIDRAVGGLFFAFRPIARHRLEDVTKIPPWIAFAIGGGRIRARGPEGASLDSPEDGGSVSFTFRGERGRASQRVVAGALVQSFAVDDAMARNECSLSEDGTTLTVKITMSSKHLRDPISYSLTYRRTS
jgi:hypothetical protein